MNIKQIVERNDTPAGKAFDLTIQALVIVSIVSFSLDTWPNLSDTEQSILRSIEVVTVFIFTIEYIVRLIVSDHRLRFATSFFGLIDFIAIVPFYLSLGVDLRSVRAFRLMRLFRLFKLGRYSKAFQRFHRALIIAREEMMLFGAVAMIVLYLSAVGIYYFENEAQPEAFASVFHSLWWATCTLTTVGYGDVYPITTAGQCFTFVVLLVGLGVVSVPAGLVASALSKAREMEEDDAGVVRVDADRSVQ